MLKLIKQYVNSVFSLDFRSLAFFRVSLGLFLLSDLYIRSLYMKAFYTDFGVLPRSILLLDHSNRFNLSLHLLGGTEASQWGLFSLNAVLLILFTIGFRTKLMNFLCWFFLISLQSRNGMVLQGGDVLIRVLMFWCLFLPMGVCYSVDAALDTSEEKKRPQRILSMGTAALYIQFLIFYWFSVVNKSGKEWWSEGSAVYYALSVDHFATSWAHFILNHAPFYLLKLMTYATLAVETIGTGLILVTSQNSWARLGVVLLVIGLHASFRSCLNVSIFPIISSIFMFAFIPSKFWNTLYAKLSQKQKKITIYFDGQCRFCKKMVALFKTFLVLNTEVYEAQKFPKIFKEMEKYNSWIVETSDGQKFYKFDAVICCFQESLFYSPLTKILSWAWIKKFGTKAYEWVASHRIQSAQYVKWLRWGPLNYQQGKVSAILSLFFIIFIFAWNAGDVNWPFSIPRSLYFVGPTFRIDQAWDMFSPYPMRNDGWYIIPGKLKNGTSIDLLTKKSPVSFEKPTNISEIYPTHHWEKYVRNMLLNSNKDLFLYWGKYICRTWNAEHVGEEELSTFSILYMKEFTLPNYEKPEIKKIDLWDHDCFLKTKN